MHPGDFIVHPGGNAPGGHSAPAGSYNAPGGEAAERNAPGVERSSKMGMNVKKIHSFE